MKWIRQVLGLCQHKWATVQRYSVSLDDRPRGELWLLQCEHCGDMKTKRVR
jgi:hypothetical protein